MRMYETAGQPLAAVMQRSSRHCIEGASCKRSSWQRFVCKPWHFPSSNGVSVKRVTARQQFISMLIHPLKMQVYSVVANQMVAIQYIDTEGYSCYTCHDKIPVQVSPCSDNQHWPDNQRWKVGRRRYSGFASQRPTIPVIT